MELCRFIGLDLECLNMLFHCRGHVPFIGNTGGIDVFPFKEGILLAWFLLCINVCSFENPEREHRWTGRFQTVA